MHRLHLSSALTMVFLLACGGSQPAKAPQQPEAQQPVAEAEPEPPADAEADTEANAEASAEADTEAKETAPEHVPDGMHAGPSAWDGESIGSWIAAVVALQKERGQEIRVRVPLVISSDGWGCVCPRTFIGASPDSSSGGDTWITVNASGLPAKQKQRLKVPKSSNKPYPGTILIVDGYFPGTRTKVDLRDKRREPPEWLYQTWNLRVTEVLETYDGESELFVYSEQAVDAKPKAP